MYKTDDDLYLDYKAFIIQKGTNSDDMVVKLGTTRDRFAGGTIVFPFDLASADMDQVSDENGFLHDEIIMARAYRSERDLNSYLWLSIFDGEFNEMVFWGNHFYNRLVENMSLTTGDFNGDGLFELAVGMRMQVGTKPEFQIVLFEVDNSGEELKIEMVASAERSHVDGGYDIYDGKGINLVAGDFNGDGNDDLALSNSHGVVAIDVNRSDDGWEFYDKGYYASNFSPSYPPMMVAGLFDFDPTQGFGMDRRQLVQCGLSGSGTSVDCEKYVFGEHLEYISKQQLSQEFFGSGKYWGSVPVWVTSGNLYGHGFSGEEEERTDPREQIVVSYLLTNKDKNVPYSRLLGIDPATQEIKFRTWAGDGDPYRGDQWGPLAVLMYDADGDSYALGDPVHIVFSNHLSLSALIQEPPKHVDYLPLDPTNPRGNWGVVNVSGGREFFVELKDSEGTSFQTETKDGTSWTIGGGSTVKTKEAYKIGDPKLPTPSGSVFSEQKLKVAYQYDSASSNWNSEYRSSQITYQSKTDHDDILEGKFQLIDLWRYPILGVKNQDPDNPAAFLEIPLPGPKKSFQGGGMNFADWYQPLHENKNILSYPNANKKDFPDDLGMFTLEGGGSIQDTMNKMDLHYFDGTSQRLDLSWTEQSGGGSEKSYTHKLGENVDITVGGSAQWKWGIGKVALSGSVTVNFNNENSWSNLETTKSTNTKSKGIAINKPTGDPNKSYAFKSAVYVGKGTGTLKVTHATDPVGSSSGQLWWEQQYGRLPDPALNLPNRFIIVDEDEDEFALNEEHSRMELRGFILREGDPDPKTGEYAFLGGPPKDGDVIRLCARIYNFALNNPTGEFDVLFETVQIDKIGEEVRPRQAIGMAKVELDSILPVIDHAPMVEACVPWDTTGFFSPDNTYRFYVTLDPEDEVDELHEWKDSRGEKLISGNNEGFWPWGSAGYPVLQPDEQTDGSDTELPGIFTHEDSLALRLKDRFESTDELAVVEVGNSYQIRAHLQADGDHRHFQNVVFSEGPFSDGKVIAIRKAGIIEGDNFCWAQWTPRNAGVAKLHVYVMENEGSPTIGEAEDTLLVNVRAKPFYPKSWRDGIIDLLK